MATSDDAEIVRTISELMEREHSLREAHGAGEATSEDERAELDQLEVQLDQCWDLLRRRRARREYGQPEETQVRDADTVENYKQ
jgi:hypothetical protein